MARNKTDSVRQLQRTLYRKAKQGKEVKFYSLYDKMCREDVLWEAWRQVKVNKGAAGVDGESIEAVVASGQEGSMINRLQQQLSKVTEPFLYPRPCCFGTPPKRQAQRLDRGQAGNVDGIGDQSRKDPGGRPERSRQLP